MDSKKVIEKLIKIAENQQKIITRLAQQAGIAMQPTGWQDVTHSVAQVLASLPGGKHASVQSAQMGSDGIHITINVRDLSSTVDQELRTALAGKPLTTSDGKQVQAPGAAQIKVISQMG